MVLDIQDPNTTFEINYIKKGKFHRQTHNYTTGKLSRYPARYMIYGITNENYIIIKNVT